MREPADTTDRGRRCSASALRWPDLYSVHIWNFPVLGSKRTTAWGVDPDSPYQMMSLIAEMP